MDLTFQQESYYIIRDILYGSFHVMSKNGVLEDDDEFR